MRGSAGSRGLGGGPARRVPVFSSELSAELSALWGRGRDDASSARVPGEAGSGGQARGAQWTGAALKCQGLAAPASPCTKRLGTPEVGGRPQGVTQPYLGAPLPSPATNTTKTAPLFLADAMAAGMAPWNHSIASLRPRRSFGVLPPRSRS